MIGIFWFRVAVTALFSFIVIVLIMLLFTFVGVDIDIVAISSYVNRSEYITITDNAVVNITYIIIYITAFSIIWPHIENIESEPMFTDDGEWIGGNNKVRRGDKEK